MSSIPGWVNSHLDDWGNWHIEMVWHEEGWSGENIIYSPDTHGGDFGSRPLIKDMPPRIRKIDLAVAQLPSPGPDICKARYFYHRWPKEHPRAGELIYDSDRAIWFGMGAGWFKNRLRRAKLRYKYIREKG